jgi:hypothetical protein
VNEKRHTEPTHEDDAGVTPEHGEGAMRQVDEIHQPHGHRQADADDEQQAAIGYTIEHHAD